MFDHMKAKAILTLRPASSLEEALRILIRATDGAQPVRWLEFPAAALLFLTIAGDSESGAFYVLDRKTGTWFWVDFEDEEYGGTAWVILTSLHMSTISSVSSNAPVC